MRKYFTLFCLLLICFSLLGCKKDKNELEEQDGRVIEITVKELLEIYELDSNILYATLSKKEEDYDNLLATLEDYTTQTKNDIYLIDTTDINLVECEYIDILTDSDSTLPNLYAVNKGTLELNMTIPSAASEIIKKLGSKRYGKIDMTPLLYKRETNFNDGFELLAAGKIGESYAKIYDALPKEEAKMLLEDENLYNILNSWETTIKKGDSCTYLSLNFTMKSDKLYRRYYSGKCSELSTSSLELTAYDYYTDGKILYTKLPLEDEYSKMYTIIKIDEENLNIKSTQREYNMTLFQGEND